MIYIISNVYTYDIWYLISIWSNLREVGVPSRTILHGRGVGSKCRIRVRRPVGSSGALWTCKKVKGHREYAGFGLLRNLLFLAPGMRSVSSFSAFGMFLWNSCSVSKIKGHQEHAGVGLLRDPLLLGPGMRSVSTFFAFGMTQKATERAKRSRFPAGRRPGCRGGAGVAAPPRPTSFYYYH